MWDDLIKALEERPIRNFETTFYTQEAYDFFMEALAEEMKSRKIKTR